MDDCPTTEAESTHSSSSLQPCEGQPCPKARKVRNENHIFVLGPGITEADADIAESRLPTRQVLRCLTYHQQGQGKQDACRPANVTKMEAAKTVLNQGSFYYRKANIPIITSTKACQKIIKLIDNNIKVRRIPVARREMSATIAKLSQQKIKLEKTFTLWPQNVEELIKNTEDLQILYSMQTNRKASFGSHDKLLALQMRRKKHRDAAKQHQIEKAQKKQKYIWSVKFTNQH